MSYTVSLQQRIQQLKKAQADVPNILYRVQKGAAMRAVEAAKEATPPEKGKKTGRLAGPNMITGRLLAGWDKSKVEPEVSANKLTSYLINDVDYASYVDQGHRMDKHFVPGLYIDENGQLARDPTRKGGLVVGTKTKYVKGEFMVDKAKEAYEKVVLSELDKEIGRLLD
jgi:hypothetical protein